MDKNLSQQKQQHTGTNHMDFKSWSNINGEVTVATANNARHPSSNSLNKINPVRKFYLRFKYILHFPASEGQR